MKISYEKYPVLGFKFKYDENTKTWRKRYIDHFGSPKNINFKIHSQNYHKAILEFEDSGNLDKIIAENPNIWEEIQNTTGGILNYEIIRLSVSILYKKIDNDLFIFVSCGSKPIGPRYIKLDNYKSEKKI